jgi:hypothetical protein
MIQDDAKVALSFVAGTFQLNSLWATHFFLTNKTHNLKIGEKFM